MQSEYWIQLLKRLPPEVHTSLSVVTRGGAEVIVQVLLGMENDCLMIKGRLAASQDTGRLYFLPFDSIDYIGFNRTVAEEEYRTWFGETPAPQAAVAQEPAPAAAGPSSKTPIPSRAALLERVRARTTTPGLNLSGITLPTPPPTST